MFKSCDDQDHQDVINSLICAVREGRLERARELINSFGLSYCQEWSEGYVLLRDAVKNKHVEVAKLLLTSGSRVNNINKMPSNTPLHFAVINGDIEIVKMTLDKGANIDAQNHDGRTPLHFAVINSDIEIVRTILENGANIDAKNGYGRTPLHDAIENKKMDVTELLLKHRADVNAGDNDCITPLHIATNTGHETVVKLLLQLGPKIDSQDKDSKTILHLAVEKGNLTIVKDVLKYCPDIYDKNNRSSLRIAVQGHGEEYKNIVEALLEYGLTVNQQDKNNPEVLFAAVEKGYLKIIEDLLKYGADVNMLNNSKYSKSLTPLHRAAKYKQEEVAKLLISYEADINARDKTGKTPIFYAIENADFKITKLLLTSGANIKDSPELLHIAVKKECIEIVDALLQHGADINASDKYGSTALHYTVLDDDFFKYYPYHDDIDFDDKQRIYNNIRGDIAKLLLSKGANINAQTKDGLTPLRAAINSGYAKVVEALLEYDQFSSGINNYFDLLNYSAYRCQNEICIMLVNKVANVNAKHEDVLNALHIASWNGDKEVVKVLLEFGAGINFIDNLGRTALQIASEGGNVDVVETLLEYGADINVTSCNNHTALELTMPGVRTFYGSDDEDYYDSDRAEVTAKALERHLVKMRTADLYVSEKKLLAMSSSDELGDFQDECEKEIASMKSEKMNNLNTSFYDILAKGTSSLAIYMRNENIVQVLKSDEYKTKFSIYASMIESNFRKGMKTKELLEQGYKIFHFLFNNFPELPYNCTEKIFSYLSDEDIRVLMDACKPLGICNPNPNINDAMRLY